MKSFHVCAPLCIGLLLPNLSIAQSDGDHPFTDGLGRTYLAPDAVVGPTIQPYNFTIGTAPSDFATLRLRGDQLSVADPDPFQIGMLTTLRSDVASGVPQSWRIYRDVNRIGAIWHQSTHRSLHIQAPSTRDDGQDRYSGLLLQNDAGDGMWVMNDGAPTGGRAFPETLQLLDAKGFVALGTRTEWVNPGAGNPRGPWSRLHFFHNVMGTRPQFAFRPQMRNGITLTGNSDLAYVGQWYDQGSNGTGAEVDDNSNLVIATSDDALPAGLAHRWDNISFRFMGDMGQSQGAASGVEPKA